MPLESQWFPPSLFSVHRDAQFIFLPFLHHHPTTLHSLYQVLGGKEEIWKKVFLRKVCLFLKSRRSLHGLPENIATFSYN